MKGNTAVRLFFYYYLIRIYLFYTDMGGSSVVITAITYRFTRGGRDSTFLFRSSIVAAVERNHRLLSTSLRVFFQLSVLR
jgi:hypothetical protein